MGRPKKGYRCKVCLEKLKDGWTCPPCLEVRKRLDEMRREDGNGYRAGRHSDEELAELARLARLGAPLPHSALVPKLDEGKGGA